MSLHAHMVHRFAAAFALRQRMLNFVQNIQYYMMFEVMEPNWHIMENNLKTVSDLVLPFTAFTVHQNQMLVLRRGDQINGRGVLCFLSCLPSPGIKHR